MLDCLASISQWKRVKTKIILICLFLSVFSLPVYVKIFSQNSVKKDFLQKEIYLRDRASHLPEENDQILNRLTRSDRLIFKQCSSQNKLSNDSIDLERVCSPYMDFVYFNRTHPLTALASFPGSGNTWLRLMLEETTGVFTGSIYCDRILKKAGFLGEGITSKSVILAKTHSRDRKAKDGIEFESVVFLIRNPYDAIVSEAHRQWSVGHLDSAKNEHFQNYKQWSEFVTTMSERWAKMVRVWVRDDKPLIVVRYENLKIDLADQIEHILAFLQTPFSPAQLQCVLKTELTAFKRTDTVKQKEKRAHYYYTQELKQIVKIAIRSVQPLLDKFYIEYD